MDAQAPQAAHPVNVPILVIFVLLPALGLALGWRKLVLITQGVRVTAKVVGHEDRKADAGPEAKTLRLPVVELRDESGSNVRVTLAQEAAPGTAEMGHPVRVVYPRGRPVAAAFDNPVSLWLIPALCFGPAILLLGWIVGAFIWARLA